MTRRWFPIGILAALAAKAQEHAVGHAAVWSPPLGEAENARGRREYLISVLGEAAALICQLPETDERNCVIENLHKITKELLNERTDNERKTSSDRAVHSPLHPDGST